MIPRFPDVVEKFVKLRDDYCESTDVLGCAVVYPVHYGGWLRQIEIELC
ncbi:hypothetical protein [Cryobacterium sp. Hb1]|nr:hypothetical protein [Cryobacterium sp. Hb1]